MGRRRDNPSSRAAVAWLRAARACERACRADESAEQHERLASGYGREIHLRIAAAHRKSAACHRSSAELLEGYARRAAAAPAELGKPLFMAGVAESCGTAGAALTLIADDRSQLAFAASDTVSRAAQDLEFALGEGPAGDAAGNHGPVYATGPAVGRRWPGYGPGLAALGYTTVAAVPLEAPGACIGALTVYDPQPGLKGSAVLTDVAAALTGTVLLDPDCDPELYGDTDHLDVVHQAAGALSEWADMTVGNALAVIKARAFAEGLRTEEMARQILHGNRELT